MGVVDKVALYVRTARHLHWRQWAYRPLRRAQHHVPLRLRPRVNAPAADVLQALAAEVRSWGGGEIERRIANATAILNGRFRFLNHEEALGVIDWSRRYVSHLWNYNLHYFDFALDLAWACLETGDLRYRDRFIELATSWIDDSSSQRGDGWEPYAASLRTVNWIYALLLLGDRLGSTARQALESSLAMQLEHLSRRLEWHVLANHLQKNLKALTIGGMYFGGTSARSWAKRGTELLWGELFEQVLPDGGQYERSPMYHAIALSDFLEVVSLKRSLNLPVPQPVHERVRKMAGAMAVMSHSNGRLHLFNDAAEGIAPSTDWLSSLSERALGERIRTIEGELCLPDTGYFGFARQDGERLLIDCGPIGPAYQPGHAHCDLLSFEWILGGQPVIVDSGVRGYAGDSHRSYVRSTRAHNTVSVNYQEQAEVWGTFRVGRRPRVLHAGHECSPEAYRFQGAYTPYFDRRVVHRRFIQRDLSGLEIRDSLSWRGAGRATSYLHFHPDFELSAQGSGFIATSGPLVLEVSVEGAGRITIVKGSKNPLQGWYCPEFGVALPAPVLVLEAHGDGGCNMSYQIRVASHVGEKQAHPASGDIRAEQEVL